MLHSRLVDRAARAGDVELTGSSSVSGVNAMSIWRRGNRTDWRLLLGGGRASERWPTAARGWRNQLVLTATGGSAITYMMASSPSA